MTNDADEIRSVGKQTGMETLKAFTKKLVAVPKPEIDRREKRYRARRARLKAQLKVT